MKEESKQGSEASLPNPPPIQWHPAFYAGIQIEFGKEAKYLTFESEHLLGSKPMQIDVIVKNEENRTLKKNIGRIFRRYNIIEYKGPGDYLSIDDFYKVYGYACFYKSDTRITDTIKIQGMFSEKNLWLRNLTDHIQSTEEAKRLLEEYKKHKTDKLYESVVNIIMNANKDLFKEMSSMCEALMELMKDELEERERLGEARGEQQGEDRVNQLIEKLISLNRMDDIVKSVSDRLYQKQLFAEFHL